MNLTHRVRLVAVLVPLPCSGGCAVVMAVNGNKDPDISALSVGQDRAVLLAKLGLPEKTYAASGSRVDVFRLKRGDEPSAGRALAHGVMDMLTLCIWEVVGTPIEAVQGEVFHVSVQYNCEGRVVRLIPGIAGSGIVAQQIRDQTGKVESKPTNPDAQACSKSSDFDAQLVALDVIQNSREANKRGFLQRLVSSPSSEYAISARAIARDALMSDVEKFHALATLSAVHAAKAVDPQERETYTRLSENFLKRAQELANPPSHEEIAGENPGLITVDPQDQQAAFYEESRSPGTAR